MLWAVPALTSQSIPTTEAAFSPYSHGGGSKAAQGTGRPAPGSMDAHSALLIGTVQDMAGPDAAIAQS